MVADQFEFITLACLSRILDQNEHKDHVLKSSELSLYKLQTVQSVISMTETEALLESCFETIFEQLSKYKDIISTAGVRLRIKQQRRDQQESLPVAARAGDDDETRELREQYLRDLRSSGISPLEIARIESNMMAELAMYNQQQQNESLNDGAQSESENNSRQEEEKKYEEIEEDHKEGSSIEADSRIDYHDAEKMYDTQVVLKFLRLIDIFTSISNKNQNICNFTTKVLSSRRIHILIQLLLN